MKNLTRRTFLKTTAVSAAAFYIPLRSWAQTGSASDEIRVGVVGFHGRGGDHIKGYVGAKGVRITALCDVDKKVLEGGVKMFSDAKEAAVDEQDALTGRKQRSVHYDSGPVTGFTDLRKMIESKDVDVISIATPNHWHSLAAIWAVQAGKDVYVEKPVSHNVWEGRKLVEAARKHNKIVQTGTQSRSSQGIKEAVEWVRAGNLGKILVARGLCYKPRGSIGKVEGPQPPPPGVDYDLWCGPAPMAPIRRKQFHYDWHWIWDYGCGDLGNQGIHQMDISRWFLGVDELSPRVWSVGGRLGYEDDGETPNTQIVYHDYAKAPLIFEVRGLPEKPGSKNMDRFPKEKGGSVCVVIHCEGGYVLVPNYSSATAYDKEGNEIKKWSGAEDHFKNFIKAVRSRKSSDLNADILEGHLSSALCHTGNVSYRLGKQMRPDEIREKIKGDRDATETFGPMEEHLKANNVDLEVTKASLGVFLKMDPKAERFIGNDKANEMLRRDYRKPYVVPEKV
jgi:predicted dehydrogenase